MKQNPNTNPFLSDSDIDKFNHSNLMRQVFKDLKREIKQRKFNKIDISNFKYENYEDVLLYFAYTYYMEISCDSNMPFNIETLKKYIISYDKLVQRLKQEQRYIFS